MPGASGLSIAIAGQACPSASATHTPTQSQGLSWLVSESLNLSISQWKMLVPTFIQVLAGGNASVVYLRQCSDADNRRCLFLDSLGGVIE